MVSQIAEAEQIVISCCKRLVEEFDEFWLVAALSDSSYEESEERQNSHWFKKYLTSWAERKLLPEELLSQLRKGINGNLDSLLRQVGERTGMFSVRTNAHLNSLSHEYDLVLLLEKERKELAIEVKLVFDCTIPKHYKGPKNSILHDRTKLEEAGGGLQVVFFTQLPYFLYPSGRWYGKESSDRSRRAMSNKVGISNQYNYVIEILGSDDQPLWPSPAKDNISPPFRHQLPTIPTLNVSEERIRQRYASVFRPDVQWIFNAADQLKDAAAGVAVWKRSSIRK